MADVVYGYSPEVIATIIETAPPAVQRLLLAGVVLAQPRREPEVVFEDWLVEKWVAEIRSESFRASVQYERLRAEWERA